MAKTQTVLTIGEVAEAFRVHPKTVARWTKDGRFHPVRASERGYRLYPRTEVQQRLAERQGSRYGWPADQMR